MGLSLLRGNAAILMFCGAASAVQADSWRFPATIQSQAETYGDVTVRRILDARRDQRFPDYAIEVARKDELLAWIPGVYYEKLFAAPDNSFFVGLSNDGLPGTAVIVFDKEGRLSIEVKHDIAQFDYCEHSVTRRRVWFDEENPVVRFSSDSQWNAYIVTLRDCHGREINLMKKILSAYGKSFQQSVSGGR